MCVRCRTSLSPRWGEVKRKIETSSENVTQWKITCLLNIFGIHMVYNRYMIYTMAQAQWQWRPVNIRPTEVPRSAHDTLAKFEKLRKHSCKFQKENILHILWPCIHAYSQKTMWYIIVYCLRISRGPSFLIASTDMLSFVWKGCKAAFLSPSAFVKWHMRPNLAVHDPPCARYVSAIRWKMPIASYALTKNRKGPQTVFYTKNDSYLRWTWSCKIAGPSGPLVKRSCNIAGTSIPLHYPWN